MNVRKRGGTRGTSLYIYSTRRAFNPPTRTSETINIRLRGLMNISRVTAGVAVIGPLAVNPGRKEREARSGGRVCPSRLGERLAIAPRAFERSIPRRRRAGNERDYDLGLSPSGQPRLPLANRREPRYP